MLEIERKYLDVNLAELRKKLQDLGWENQSNCFEFNYILDTENDDLFKQDKLLRLRETVDQSGFRQSVLTYKQPAKQTGNFERIDDKIKELLDARGTKIREEVELPVLNQPDILRMLSGLGYSIKRTYQKTRETWVALLTATPGEPLCSGKALVCLDCLPFGDFAEIEGSEPAIDAVEKRLGLDKMKKSSTNYHKLYQAWLEENSLPKDKPCVFDPERKREALRQIGLLPSDLREPGVWED